MATRTSRILFPLCGLTYDDCISVAGVDQPTAAKKLGVSESRFREVIKRQGMSHWYPPKDRKGERADRRFEATCPTCGRVHSRVESWRWGEFCNTECYLALPFPKHPNISMDDLYRVARLYTYQKVAAKALGVSYNRFRQVVKKFNLRDQFPERGGRTWDY